MILKQKAKCTYQDPHEGVDGYKGSITPECFVDHPAMVKVSWTHVSEAVEELKELHKRRCSLKDHYWCSGIMDMNNTFG